MKMLMIMKTFPFNWMKQSIMNLPTNMNISYMWNFGSFLGIILVIQIVTGFLLSMNYVSDSSMAFNSIIFMSRDSFFGFLLRWIHLNIGSLFFLILYSHLFRGMFFLSYRLTMAWMSGVTIMLLLMATAFLGYVLPWGQMSLWGATVITNLLSTVPFMGQALVIWVWGGFSVNTYTLGMFYSLHFLLPLLICVIVLFHIVFLHETGSTSKLFLHTNENKNKFYFLFVMKDIVNISALLFFIFLFLMSPFKLGDPENFSFANPLSSPLHIQPEWYFLFAYAILRSIPNKLGGVIALVLSVVLFYFFPFFSKNKNSLMFFHKYVIWFFLFVSLILTWIGGNPVEAPYILIGQISTFLYFFLMLFMVILCFSMN